jgi:hypothetical protein
VRYKFFKVSGPNSYRPNIVKTQKLGVGGSLRPSIVSVSLKLNITEDLNQWNVGDSGQRGEVSEDDHVEGC